LVLLVPAASAATAGHSAPSIAAGTTHASPWKIDRGAHLLAQATASLHSGHGPGAAPASPTSLAHPSTGQADSLAYDAADGYVLAIAPNVITINNTSSFGATVETWTFLGGNWTLLSLTTAPPNRGYAQMTFDVTDGYVVLFGGSTFGGSSFFPPYLNDTWSYVGGNWTNLTSTVVTAPPGRESAPMVWDASDGYVVMYGGRGMFGNFSGNLSSTWAYVGGTWWQAVAFGGPNNEGAMAYDAVDSYVLFFGGSVPSGGTSAKTWSYHSGVWTDLTPLIASSPPSRANPAMATDPNLPGVLLFGGIGQPSSGGWVYYNDTWGYANLTWTLLSNASGPSPREQSQMVFDAADNETVLFGGVNYSQDAYADTWEFGAGGNGSNGSSSGSGSWVQAAPILHTSMALDDVGLPFTLSAAGIQGATSASLSYTGLPPGCASANTIELLCIPTAAGSYTVVLTAVTSSGTAVATTRVVVTDSPSIASFQSSLAVTEPGISVTLTALALGGAGTLDYAYTGLPTSCPALNAPMLTCTPDAPGLYSILVTVTDTLHVFATEIATLNVIPNPQIMFLAVTPGAIDLGQTARIAANVAGGLAPVSYDFVTLPPGCVSTGGASVSCTPSAIGVYTFGLRVSDALGATVSAQGVLTTNPLPSVASFASSAPNVTLGHSVTFTVAVTGGTGALAVSYQGLPPGCVPVDTLTLTCSPTTTGNFTITTVVTDDVGGSGYSSLPLEVDAVPQQTPGPPGPDRGGSVSAVTVDTTTPFLIGAGLGLLALAIGAAVLLHRDRVKRAGARLVRDLRSGGSGPTAADRAGPSPRQPPPGGSR
jgi:hypothetical protein